MPPKNDAARQRTVLGANIRRERVRQGLTQAQLAEAADLALRNIQRIEAGEINILVTTLVRIQKALGCSWESLLGKSR